MRKLTLLVLLTLTSVSVCRAQYVNIPDANLATYLGGMYPACMDGSWLDTTCSSVLTDTILFVDNKGIKNLEGVQYFKNVTAFDCNTNPLTSPINKLPPKVEWFDCGYCNLSSLPALPATLKYFYIGNNPVNSLPTLPAGLKELYFVSANFTSLPALPTTMEALIIESTALTSLPALPSTLKMLSVRQTSITSLPALPASLTSLDCAFNHITSLPSLPAGLKILGCGYNPITALPVLPAALTTLNCEGDTLTALPALPANLRALDCSNNVITTLPALPDSLRDLDASANKLTLVTNLPPALYTFYIDRNEDLSCLPPMAKFLGGEFDFDISQTGITCLPNTIPHPNAASIPAIDGLPVCACAAPVFSVGTITATSGIISWPAQPCLYNYRIQYRVKGTTMWTVISLSATAFQRTLSGLTPGTTYQVRMRKGCSPTINSAWTAIQEFTTLVTCNPPATTSATNPKTDRATIKWSTATNAYSYKISYRKLGTTPWSNRTVLAPTTVKVLTGLLANTTYQYRVQTICHASGAPVSAWSTTKTFTTLLRLEDEGAAVNEILVYPNPATNQLTVSSEQLTVGDNMVITDLLGRTLISQPATSHSAQTIDISALARGVYMLRVQTAEGAVTVKVVKEQ